MIEEDYISKPSPAKKPNLGGQHGGQPGKEMEKEFPMEKKNENETDSETMKKPGQTNGIEMESDDEDTEDENLPPVPSVQVWAIVDQYRETATDWLFSRIWPLRSYRRNALWWKS